MENNFDKWVKFLDPDNLKGNLISTALYIAYFESFKDNLVEQGKSFFSCGFDSNGPITSPRYQESILSRDKNVVTATLLWLQEMGALSPEDILLFHEIRKYRNKLAHQMMTLLFEGMDQDFQKHFNNLSDLIIKFEKWWVLNIEIPTNPDMDHLENIKEEDVMTSSQIIGKIFVDILSGDEVKANYYRDELLKHKQSFK